MNSANFLPQPGIGNHKPRLIGIDATRGLALLGMIAVHALIPYDENFQPNWVSYVATGHASAVFAVLAGVGLSLTTGRARVPWAKALPTAAGVGGRALAIAVIGFALGYADAVITGVILTYYAVLFLLAIPLLFLRTRTLVVVGILAAVAVPVLSQFLRTGLPISELENPTFPALFSDPAGLLVELLLTGAYPALPWLAYICAGLIVGRLTLSSVKVARRMVLFGVTLAVVAGSAGWLLLGPLGGRAALQLAGPGLLDGDADTVNDLLAFGFDGTTPTTSWWWLASAAPHAGTPLDLLGTIGSAVASARHHVAARASHPPNAAADDRHRPGPARRGRRDDPHPLHRAHRLHELAARCLRADGGLPPASCGGPAVRAGLAVGRRPRAAGNSRDGSGGEDPRCGRHRDPQPQCLPTAGRPARARSAPGE